MGIISFEIVHLNSGEARPKGARLLVKGCGIFIDRVNQDITRKEYFKLKWSNKNCSKLVPLTEKIINISDSEYHTNFINLCYGENTVNLLQLDNLKKRETFFEDGWFILGEKEQLYRTENRCAIFCQRNGKSVVFPLLTDRAYSPWPSIRAPFPGAVVFY